MEEIKREGRKYRERKTDEKKRVGEEMRRGQGRKKKEVKSRLIKKQYERMCVCIVTSWTYTSP